MENGINGVQQNKQGWFQCTQQITRLIFKSMPQKRAIKWIIYPLEGHFQLIKIYVSIHIQHIEINLFRSYNRALTKNKRSIASNDFFIIMENKEETTTKEHTWKIQHCE